MKTLIGFEEIEDKIITLRGQKVLLDRDVATLCGVETKRVNEALRNNLDKFPKDYCFTLQVSEKQYLVENFDRFSSLKHSPVEPKAFTEKGLYMLATVLKSPRATATTLAIIESFAHLRELSRNLNILSTETEEQQKSLLEKSGDLFTDLLDNNLQATDSETTIELNLAVLKVKHTVKRKADKE